ncbi:MAG: glycosyltransferase [Fervidobacterium sp.]
MRKLLVLSNQIPDPRIIKRLNSLNKFFDESHVLYWERDFGNGFSFPKIEGVISESISTTSNPSLVKRIFENRGLIEKTVNKILTYGPDVIYISGVELLWAIKKVPFKRKPIIILEIPDLPANTHISKLGFFGKFIEKILINVVKEVPDYYVITSPGFYHGYYERYGFDKNKFFVFENVPPKDIFETFKIDPEKVTDKEKLVIGYIGAVAYYSSLRMLFEACKNIENVEIVIAGKGPDSEKVEREAKKYRNVKVLGKYIYEKDISRLYSMVDVVYSLYNTDNYNVKLALPNKLYESIVCGKPIIVASGTYLEEYVKKLGIGFSAPYNDVEALRALIENINNDRKKLSDISKKCVEIRNGYFYESVEEEFIKWLERVYFLYDKK